MKTQKCCSHCPGHLLPRGSNKFDECCQPNYVSGNLRVSSLSKQVSESFERKGTEKNLSLPDNQSFPRDQFALAKRLHAENLEHHPLPDKVHDSIFKNSRPKLCGCQLPLGKFCECCEQVFKSSSKKLNKRYGVTLGCKEPKTKMDLAICWETPIDPTYEPSRSTHIDGSEGGVAPAIFTLIEHASDTFTDKFRSGCRRKKNDRSDCCQAQHRINTDSKELPGNEYKDDRKKKCCCECLCEGLNELNVSKKGRDKVQSRRSFRKCTVCEPKNFKDDPRLTRSSVELALELEKGDNNRKKNDGITAVPRPRTPFARKSFCIDTLAPPFSVVNGYRDTDYPEHWRLMSVYQQSYKNPYRRKILHRC